ncbi:MAG: tRNA (adenosine(37)-N6)-threonylcarbamoyltransferase complex ATPase subunit type 1 TsaE [Bacteroidales bacterium]|nr:MAG: tRNA (adenosine(37)-N6)-threonylcarbamoyltransferase complex ATPase subunit type 1 TsaE [Bacteroidales bacterium]
MEQVTIQSLSEINKAAKSVLQMIGKSRIICFYGSMGAGKTTLIKAICHELGVTDNVASPTFALINEYRDRNFSPIYHFDFYRINKIEEVFDFGYEEYFYKTEGICLIEWPELIEDILPSVDVCKISIITNSEGVRSISKL